MRFKEQHITLRRGRGTSNLLLRFNQSFLIQHSPSSIVGERYRVNVLSWDYTIYDHNERDILAYHWHPEGTSDKTAPHFHVGSVILDTTSHELGKTFSRLHLPSGYITIADVVRTLIEEFNVVPIHDRWDETLRACQQELERQRDNP